MFLSAISKVVPKYFSARAERVIPYATFTSVKVQF